MLDLSPPFRIDVHETRIYVVDARGWSFEVIASQYHGFVPTTEETVHMAQRIAEALNGQG